MSGDKVEHARQSDAMIKLWHDGEIARLRLCRPHARNSITLAGWDALRHAVHQAVAEGARVIVIDSDSAGGFCAGADMSAFDAFREDERARSAFRITMRAALDAVRNCSIPTIALIDGGCYGAGVALAISCDVRIATRAAAFATTPAKLAIGYPQEDVHRLVSLIGPGQAARMLLAAGTLDAEEAARIGLVEQIGVEADAIALAAACVAADGESHAYLKRSIALAVSGQISDERQDGWFDALLGSDRLAERLARHRSRAR